MALTWSYDTHTEIGLVRSTNQDSAFASPRLLMVADGMGGAAAGDLASAVATWELARTDADLPALLDAARATREAGATASGEEHGDSSDDVLTVMESTLARANERLVALVEEDPGLAGMGTTVCGFVLHDDRVAVVNIGDSRAYLIRDGELHRVTRDHSWVQTLVDEGRISEREALEHPHRSLVLRVLNGSSQHEPDLGWLDVRAGDRLLVCSDGLCGLATDDEIAEVATTGAPRPDVLAGLVKLAHARGGHDNITLVLADVETDGPAGAPVTIGAAASVVEPAAESTRPQPIVADAEPEAPDERAITEEERYALLGRRRFVTRVRWALAFLIPVLALAGGGGLWYQYTQTQYFVGPADARVAVFRGVPDDVLGLPLSTLVETDTTALTDLPPYYADRVRSTIPVASLDAARSTLEELRAKAAQCIAQRRARAQATATPSADASPTASAGPTPLLPTPGPTSGPAPSPDASPTPSGPPITVGVTPTTSGSPSPLGEDC